jgi:hypothetical protein
MGAIVMIEPFVTTRTLWPQAKPSAASHFPFSRMLGTEHSFFLCAQAPLSKQTRKGKRSLASELSLRFLFGVFHTAFARRLCRHAPVRVTMLSKSEGGSPTPMMGACGCQCRLYGVREKFLPKTRGPNDDVGPDALNHDCSVA